MPAATGPDVSPRLKTEKPESGHGWKPFDREPVIYDGVACCIFVDESGVELIPEDENEGKQWSVDVLRLPADKQQAILDQLP